MALNTFNCNSLTPLHFKRLMFMHCFLLCISQRVASQGDIYSVPSDNSLYTLLENMVNIFSS